MSERIKRMAKAVANPQGVPILPATGNPKLGRGIYYLGNRFAGLENLTEEGHNHRAKNWFKACATIERKRRGEKVMTVKEKKERKYRERVRLRETIELEARQVQSIARKAAPEVMKMLEEVVRNKSKIERTSDRISAANVLLERAYGKANQTNTNVNVDANGKAAEISSKELATRIEETIKRIDSLTVGVPEEKPSKERPADIRKCDGDPGGSTLH